MQTLLFIPSGQVIHNLLWSWHVPNTWSSPESHSCWAKPGSFVLNFGERDKAELYQERLLKEGCGVSEHFPCCRLWCHGYGTWIDLFTIWGIWVLSGWNKCLQSETASWRIFLFLPKMEYPTESGLDWWFSKLAAHWNHLGNLTPTWWNLISLVWGMTWALRGILKCSQGWEPPA